MKRLLLSIFVTTMFISFLFFGNFNEATAAECPETPCPSGTLCFRNPLCFETFGDLIDAMIRFIFNMAMFITPLMIIIGAFYLLTAAGDPKRVGTGKTIIIYTLIGLALILLSRAVIGMIEKIIGVNIGG